MAGAVVDVADRFCMLSHLLWSIMLALSPTSEGVYLDDFYDDPDSHFDWADGGALDGHDSRCRPLKA